MHNGSTTLQDLFDLYKKRVLEQLDAVSIFDDAAEYQESFKDIEMKIRAMSSLIDIRLDLNIDSSSYIPTPQLESAVVIDDIEEDSTQKTYVFERKLRGGLIHLDDSDYFVPEQMVRHMNVTHGDEVEITREYMNKGMKRYIFRIVNRIGKHPENRIQLSHYVVTSSPDNDSLILHSDLQGKHNNPSHLYYISHNDIENYSLKAGSVVDAAYYVDNPEGISIIFKHTKTVDAQLHVKKYGRPQIEVANRNVFYLHSPSLENSRQDHAVLEFIETHFNGEHTTAYGVEMQETLMTNIRNADLILINHEQVNSKTSQFILEKVAGLRGEDSLKECILLSKELYLIDEQLNLQKKKRMERLESSL